MVENRSGAGTFIAMQAVAKDPADGHILSFASNAVLATAPIMPGTPMPIDQDRALVPVMNLIRVPMMVLVARPDAPCTTLPQLIAYAKAHPGKLDIGQSGIGMEQIQYRGGTPALRM